MRMPYWQQEFIQGEINLKNIIDAALIISGALIISACIIANEWSSVVIAALLWAIEIALCLFRKIKK